MTERSARIELSARRHSVIERVREHEYLVALTALTEIIAEGSVHESAGDVSPQERSDVERARETNGKNDEAWSSVSDRAGPVGKPSHAIRNRVRDFADQNDESPEQNKMCLCGGPFGH